MKKILLIVLCLGIVLIFWIYHSVSKAGSKGGETQQSVEFMEYMPIDKLFTAFAYVPIIRYERDYLKRDIYNRFYNHDEKKKVIIGYCYREYDVGIGYDHPTDSFDVLQKIACQNLYKELPEPVILSINPISSEVVGKYSRTDCDNLDLDDSGTRKSQQLILKQLKEDGQWNVIVENSQKALASFIRVYCP